MKQDFILEASGIIEENLNRLKFVDMDIKHWKHGFPDGSETTVLLDMLASITKSIYDTNSMLKTMLDDEVAEYIESTH